MQSASGQGTVEYVGVLLLVAVLIGALAGGIGVPRATAGIASSIARAILGAIGSGGSASVAGPSSSERAAFARATDPRVPPDDRSSLRDVRLSLIAAHGEVRGRQIYRELVLDDLRRVVPGLAGGTRFGTAPGGGLPSGGSSAARLTDRIRSLEAPTGTDAGEIETPVGTPNAHVVTVDEADVSIDQRLHPGTTFRGFAMDALSAVPFVGLGLRAARLALAAEKGIWAVTTATSGVAATHDLEALLSPSEAALPPGMREGDELVSWVASRQAVGGGPRRLFARAAVVRAGVVLRQDIRTLSAGHGS